MASSFRDFIQLSFNMIHIDKYYKNYYTLGSVSEKKFELYTELFQITFPNNVFGEEKCLLFGS